MKKKLKPDTYPNSEKKNIYITKLCQNSLNHYTWCKKHKKGKGTAPTLRLLNPFQAG